MNKIVCLLVTGLIYSGILFADSSILAPGYSALKFKAPEPGSYTLPIIGSAADGSVLTTANKKQQLHDLMGDKIVLLSFIYSTCSDVNGCPLATGVFHKINRRLQKVPELAKQLRLLTLSFNPEHDTPEAMHHYAEGFANDIVDWQFLTTESEQKLQPILDQYQQSIQKVYDEEGQFTGTFSHILRVYLIDKSKKLRNIYSVSFLHADTLVNDVKTLLNENQSAPPKKPQQTVTNKLLFQAGDNKQHYQQEDYKTQAIALTQRRGHATDLVKNSWQPQLGLPIAPAPEDNPMNAEKIALGKKLFFDRRLSLNNTFSCAMCHIPEQGFSSNEMATAVGIEGRSVRRNSPTIYNTAYAKLLFHDGRENSLEQQVWGPLLAHNEMANPSVGYVIDKINAFPDYQDLFEQSFAQPANMITIGQAIASYERSLISANSPFDQWYFGKQGDVVKATVKKGFKLFTGKAGCSACHTIDKNYALFTDNQLHNTGIGYQDSMGIAPKQQKIQIAPGLFVDVDTKDLLSIKATKPNDLGQYEITQNPLDRWKYKTAGLRNISLTAPYMHNGSLLTLEDVVKFYNQGGVKNENLDPLIKPLDLSEKEISDLVAFLKSLTGSNVNQLVSDAYTAPIGDM